MRKNIKVLFGWYNHELPGTGLTIRQIHKVLHETEGWNLPPLSTEVSSRTVAPYLNGCLTTDLDTKACAGDALEFIRLAGMKGGCGDPTCTCVK
jgi:hypothetical protein